MTIDDARKLLETAGVFYGPDDELADYQSKRFAQMLNMNDVWGWATADGEYVEDEELPEVARLFWDYGWCGILYWVSEKRGHMKSEFEDNNRFIEFVRNEEAIKKEIPGSSERAYAKRSYTIGAT